MSDRRTFVIVGGGLAGAKAAQTLRAEGFDGGLVLVGAEPELPYERPPLSKSCLAGETPFAEARVHDRAFYDEHGVELMTGRAATSFNPAAHEIGLHDAGDRLVIRGSTDAGTFHAFWIGGEGRLTAGMHANDRDAGGTIARLVESGARMDAEALASVDVALEAVG